MPSKHAVAQSRAVAEWAKRCYLAGRGAMEAALRPFGLGATQWYVLHHLTEHGPTMQRDLLRTLQVERATLSVIVGALVRKGLVEQVPDHADQRQKRLQMTPAGAALWAELPDLTSIHQAAFGELDAADLATAIKVLQTATTRLSKRSTKGSEE